MSLWSITEFGCEKLARYANTQLVEETRKGVKAMSLILLGLVSIAGVFSFYQAKPVPFFYSYSLVAILCIHIWISVHKIEELKALHLLGMALLVVSATAFVSIAHQTGTFGLLVSVNIMFLFLLVPMVPWGLREAVIIIFAVYCLLSLSTGLSTISYSSETLITLQYLMVCSALISVGQVVMRIRMRKSELTSFFDLHNTETHLRKLSVLDSLTGAWNRRYFSTALTSLVGRFTASQSELVYVLFDFDDFKYLNDTFGHNFGDYVLKVFSETFGAHVKDTGFFFRLGGDEFSLILCHPSPDEFVAEGIRLFRERVSNDNQIPGVNVGISYGLVVAALSEDTDLTQLYKDADKILYRCKRQSKKTKKKSEVRIAE